MVKNDPARNKIEQYKQQINDLNILIENFKGEELFSCKNCFSNTKVKELNLVRFHEKIKTYCPYFNEKCSENIINFNDKFKDHEIDNNVFQNKNAMIIQFPKKYDKKVSYPFYWMFSNYFVFCSKCETFTNYNSNLFNDEEVEFINIHLKQFKNVIDYFYDDQEPFKLSSLYKIIPKD